MRRSDHSITWRILSYLLPYKKEFVFAGFLLVAATGIGFLQPLILQEITDKGMLAQDLPMLCRTVTVLALLVLLNQAVEMAQTRLFVKIHNKSFYNIFHQIFQKLMRLKKTYFEDKNNAEIAFILLVGIGVAAWQVYLPIQEDNESVQAYEDLRKYVQKPTISLDAESSGEVGAESQEPTESHPSGASTLETEVPAVDFVALREINPDIVGWLTIPGTNIDYPIAQHSDNDYYFLPAVFSQPYSRIPVRSAWEYPTPGPYPACCRPFRPRSGSQSFSSPRTPV